VCIQTLFKIIFYVTADAKTDSGRGRVTPSRPKKSILQMPVIVLLVAMRSCMPLLQHLLKPALAMV